MDYSALKKWPIFNFVKLECLNSEIHKVMVYGMLGSKALVVMKNKKVYGLDNSTTSSHNSFPDAREIKEFYGKGVKKVCMYKGSLVLVLTENGEVYYWGTWKDRKYVVAVPTLFNIPTTADYTGTKRVKDIACCISSVLILTEEGKVFTWDERSTCLREIIIELENYDSKLEKKVDSQSISSYSQARNPIVRIACNHTCCVMVTETGGIYKWTCGNVASFLELGRKERIVAVGVITELVKLVCGSSHALALTDKGKVYAWGSNTFGQLGISNTTRFPQAVMHNMGRVTDIAALSSSNISVAINENGNVYMWGECYGRKFTAPYLTPFSSVYDVLAYYSSPSSMHEPMILHEKDTQVYSNIFKCFENEFNNESTSDLVFMVENQPIYVHKTILKIRCQYFRTMFQHNWLENSQSVIKHNEFCYTVFEAFLKYLYTDVVTTLPLEEAVELLKLADAYCEDSLKHCCSRIINQEINVTNVLFLYNIAVKYRAKGLEEFCGFFVAKNNIEELKQELNELVRTQKDLDKIEMLNSLLVEASKVKYDEGHIEYITRTKTHLSNLENWPIFSFVKPEFISGMHKVMVYGTFCNRALVIMKNKKVYALDNSITSVQNRFQDNTLCPNEVKELYEKDVKTIVCNNKSQILALTENGEIYLWDNNHVDELNNRIDVVAVPTLVNIPEITITSPKQCIVDIACGEEHFLVVTNRGQVFAWGNNEYGQLGFHFKVTNVRVPRCIFHFGNAHKQVFQIECGQNFSVAVTTDGKVYTWGSNSFYQLGTRSKVYNKRWEPRAIPRAIPRPIPRAIPRAISGAVLLPKIAKVACGSNHALALTKDGELYAWGANYCGQLGIGETNSESLPCLVKHNMGRVIDIAALYSSDISVAISENGRFYMWGGCRGETIMVPTLTPFSTVHDILACYASPGGMHKPLVLHGDHIPVLPSWSLFEFLQDAFNDESTSDLTIIVEEQSIYVHKEVLKIRCQYFKDMFRENLLENNQSVIKYTEFSYITFKIFLKYLYTDLVDLPRSKRNEVAVELLKLANAYREDNLARYCIELIKPIRIKSVFDLYCLASEHNVKEVEKLCINFTLVHIIKMEKKINEITTTEDVPERLHMLETFKRELRLSCNFSCQLCRELADPCCALHGAVKRVLFERSRVFGS